MSKQALFPLLMTFAVMELVLGLILAVVLHNVAIGTSLIAIGMSLVAIAVTTRKKTTHG